MTLRGDTGWEETAWVCGCHGGRPEGRSAWMMTEQCPKHADVKWAFAMGDLLLGVRDGERVSLLLEGDVNDDVQALLDLRRES